MFLPAQLADYRALRDAGRDVAAHDRPLEARRPGRRRRERARCAGDGSTSHLLGGDIGSPRARVRLFVGGDRRWVDVEEWPPPARSVRWHLQPDGALHPRKSPASPPDRYRYDPADPTPSVGGTVLASSAGPRDNRALERRADVLVYSSAPLARDVEIMGPVTADLHVRSTLDHTDFFVRLCDVEPSGKSLEHLRWAGRLTPETWQRQPDGSAHVDGRASGPPRTCSGAGIASAFRCRAARILDSCAISAGESRSRRRRPCTWPIRRSGMTRTTPRRSCSRSATPS